MTPTGSSTPWRYLIHGLTVSSEIELPGLRRATTERVDLTVRRGEVPDALTEPCYTGHKFQGAENCILIVTDWIAKILICDGRTVKVEARPGALDAWIRHLILGWALSAALHQRRILAFHGSAVRAGDRCVVFCGRSGSGKSTLALALTAAGFELLDDNAAAVTGNSERGGWTVHPGSPTIKICPNALDLLPSGVTVSSSLAGIPGKQLLGLASSFCPRPLPLGTIYMLELSDGSLLETRDIRGREKLAALSAHICQPEFAAALGCGSDLFVRVREIADRAEVVHLRLPRGESGFRQMVDLLAGRGAYSGEGGVGFGTPARSEV